MTVGTPPGHGRPTQTRVADRLLAERRITREAYDSAVAHHRRSGGRIEESLIDVKAVAEGDLLAWLSAAHQARFVTTEKLAKAEIDRATLEKVQRKIADKYQIVPVLFDAQSSVLQIVTADPDNVGMLDEVRLGAGVREVRPCIARPAAAKAAVRKFYHGDQHAFTLLTSSEHDQLASMMNLYERNVRGNDMSPSFTTRERIVLPSDLGADAPASLAGTSSSDNWAETLNVLVSLLENGRPDLRGHSAHVARLTRKLGERLSLGRPELSAVVTAAYVHDLGKMGTYHLTPLNVAEYGGHRVIAEKSYATPRRLLETVSLAPATTAALDAMYERFDGKGVPGERAGKEIPLGARLLAITDSFADLTQNPRNPYRAALKPIEACDVLARYRGTVFDPNLVDLFRATVTGDDIRARILSNRHVVLLIDTDAEETTVLELRLIEQGFEVRIARTSEQAWKLLESGEIALVVSELDIVPADGLALLAEVRKVPWGRELPWIVLTRRQARGDAQRGFDLGILDYMLKPAATDVLVAKLKQALEKRASGKVARGVSGSLEEMSLPDLVQLLWHGRKSGSLRVWGRAGESGEIHFAEGSVVNALWGALRGEPAFFAMLEVQSGDFALDPDFKARDMVIDASPEALLLEGMRRLDEGHRGA